jgi:hypothetical protein
MPHDDAPITQLDSESDSYRDQTALSSTGVARRVYDAAEMRTHRDAATLCSGLMPVSSAYDAEEASQ